MPIEPREGETQDEFIERCMSEEEESIPDQDQRLAACFDMWRRDKGESEASLTQAMQQKVIDFLAQKGKDAGFQIKAQKRAAEILIYGEIGDDLFGGVSARSFADALAKAGRIDTITVRLNSPGGNVFDGVAIYNTLRNHKAKVTVAIDGLAASAASIVAMAGDDIEMAENAIMMIHEPWYMAIGTATELRAIADSLDKIRDGMAKTYAARSGQTFEQALAWMQAETWFSAEEAVAAGLADRMGESMKVAAAWDIMAWRKRYRNPPDAAFEEFANTDTTPADGTPVAAYQDRLDRMSLRMKEFSRQAG